MMKYKLIFSPAFTRDLDNTFAYISQTLIAPQAAKKLMKEIDASIMNLKEFPEMHPLCQEPLDELGYRKIIIKNYVLIYFVDKSEKTVNLLRCFYGKSDYMKFFR